MEESNWIIEYGSYNPEEERKIEALMTLGNGVFATRGAAEETQADTIHYPGTYLAGGWNRLTSKIESKEIENEDLVNWPNWLCLTFRPADGQWLNLDQMELLDYQKTLYLKKGYLFRRWVVRDEHKRETEIMSYRLISLARPHLAIQRWELRPLNWSGDMELHSAIDGSVINKGVPRYRDLAGQHLQPLETGYYEADCIFLVTQSKTAKDVMALAARTEIENRDELEQVHREYDQREDYIAECLHFNVVEGHQYTINKKVAIHTSRDFAVFNPLHDSIKKVRHFPSYQELLQKQAAKYQSYWNRYDVELVSDDEQDQRLIRLHIFHLFQTATEHSVDVDAGIPSRGWHGEAYRGHILWDELYILPLINASMPTISRALLMYRYRRLDAARQAAQDAGYQGAMFPWQSGSNGREESQFIHLNPESGNWIPDNTYLQRHVNSAIAYNVWQYYQMSGDRSFMAYFGAELMIEIARFWASKAQYSEHRKHFEIKEVVGPDEYHTYLPDSDELGLKNNTYTNVMAVWVLIHTRKALDRLPERRRQELFHELDLNTEELDYWEKVSRNMYIHYLDDTILAQFEGYGQLKELNWEQYREQHGEFLRLDRILESEGKDPNDYKASKQADVLMLFYLFSFEELQSLFDYMGYELPRACAQDNLEYYTKRTSHGSTLSKLVASWVFSRKDRHSSWRNFEEAIVSDFNDVQGGTTEEGIHLGAMAGMVDLIQRCYTGLEYRDDTLWFNPTIPPNIEKLSFRLLYRDFWIKVIVRKDKLFLACDGGEKDKITIRVKDQKHAFWQHEKMVFKLYEKTAELVSG